MSLMHFCGLGLVLIAFFFSCLNENIKKIMFQFVYISFPTCIEYFTQSIYMYIIKIIVGELLFNVILNNSKHAVF